VVWEEINMKRKKLGLIILCFIMLFSFNAYAKKPSKSSAKKAYKKYIAKTLSKLLLESGGINPSESARNN
jgi:hypothetical protein